MTPIYRIVKLQEGARQNLSLSDLSSVWSWPLETRRLFAPGFFFVGLTSAAGAMAAACVLLSPC